MKFQKNGRGDIIMKPRILIAALSALAAIFASGWCGANAKDAAKAPPLSSIPTFPTENIGREGHFYVGGPYEGEPGKEIMFGAKYVEVMVPKKIQHPFPIVFICGGAGPTAVTVLQTPDGRPGWAYDFLNQGYTVYVMDYPGRGRSLFFPNSDADGKLSAPRTSPLMEEVWSGGRPPSTPQSTWPQYPKQTQWPGDGSNKGKMGDPIFDAFAKTQVQFLAGGKQAQLNLDAHIALLDMIGTPVILLTHSQGGEFGWQIADARPKLVKAIITAEPAGPPIKGVDIAKIAYNQNANLSWGVTSLLLHYDPPVNDPSELQPVLEEKSEGPDIVPCYLQKEPAHKLVNLKDIPVLDVSGEASYHRVFDSCIAKWLNQAGVKTEYVKMEDAGLTGNEHEMMLDKNSDEIAKFFATWLDKHAH